MGFLVQGCEKCCHHFLGLSSSLQLKSNRVSRNLSATSTSTSPYPDRKCPDRNSPVRSHCLWLFLWVSDTGQIYESKSYLVYICSDLELETGTKNAVSNQTLVVTDGQRLSSLKKFIVPSNSLATVKTGPSLHLVYHSQTLLNSPEINDLISTP